LVRKMSRKAFSLIEAGAAVMILALLTSSIVLIMDRSVKSVADTQTRIKAFELVRENMEKLLASDSVRETIDAGTCEGNQDIKWQTVVEPFYESNTKRMWIRAVCSSTFTDYDGQEETVELTHWLTDVSKQQMLKIIKEEQRRRREQEEARQEYEEQQQQDEDEQASEELSDEQAGEEPSDEPTGEEPSDEPAPPPEQNYQQQDNSSNEETFFGFTQSQLDEMSFDELWAILVERGYF